MFRDNKTNLFTKPKQTPRSHLKNAVKSTVISILTNYKDQGFSLKRLRPEQLMPMLHRDLSKFQKHITNLDKEFFSQKPFEYFEAHIMQEAHILSGNMIHSISARDINAFFHRMGINLDLGLDSTLHLFEDDGGFGFSFEGSW